MAHAVIVAMCYAAAFVGADETAAASLRDLLQQACKDHGLPALGTAVIVDGRLVACEVVGVRKLGDPTPATADDQFHIGSCAKAMTATVIGILIDQKKLRWDSTLEEIFPELKTTMHSGYRRATIEQILAHRAGMPGDSGMRQIDLRRLSGTNVREQRLAFLTLVLSHPPASDPGTRYEYSNAGYTVLGAIAEHVTNDPWEDLLARLLLKPLGMRHTAFGETKLWGYVGRENPSEPAGGVSTPAVSRSAPLSPRFVGRGQGEGGNSQTGNGTGRSPSDPPGFPLTADMNKFMSRFATQHPEPCPPGPNRNEPPFMSPAGSNLRSSMADLARFAALHLGTGADEPSLLKPETLKRLHTPPQTQDRYMYFAGWFTSEASWSKGPALMHPGITPWSYCLIWIAPGRNSALIVATNMGPPRGKKACDDILARLAKEFLRGD